MIGVQRSIPPDVCKHINLAWRCRSRKGGPDAPRKSVSAQRCGSHRESERLRQIKVHSYGQGYTSKVCLTEDTFTAAENREVQMARKHQVAILLVCFVIGVATSRPAAWGQDHSIVTPKDIIFARKILMATIANSMYPIDQMLQTGKIDLPLA